MLTHTVLAVLVKEEGVAHMPVYYRSYALQGAELRYPLMEMLVFALMTIARWVQKYFQAHPIKEVTNSPLRKMLQLAGGAIELSEFEID